MNCQKCGQETFLPFRCTHCGGQFCSAHRLPENHSCPRADLAHLPKQEATAEVIAPQASSYEYSVTFGQPRQIQNRVYVSPKEAKHLSVAALLVGGIGFSIVFYAAYMERLGWTWAVASVFALLLTASFLVHEMAHKVIAQRRGLWAEFRLTTWGAMLTLVSVILPFKLISPGAVMISGPVRLGEVGKISIAGPSINLALCSMFLGAAFIPAFIPSSYVSLFCIVAYINATIAVFNLIPFGILDGFKIYSWNKKVWVLAFAVAVALAVPSYMMASPYIF
jgi:Zn-dependent protease